MKQVAFILGLALLMPLTGFAKCERLELYGLNNLQVSMETDLTTNTWSTDLLGTPSTLYFRQDGLLLALPDEAGRVKSYNWTLFAFHGCAQLSVIQDGVEKSFWLAPTCNGLAATTDDKSIQMVISTKVQLSGARQEFVTKQLTGVWHYRQGNARKAHKAGFSIALNRDGTFALKTGPDKYHSSNEGDWHVTADGQYLILSTYSYVDLEKVCISEAIALRSVDFEDMVIDARQLPRALEPYQGRQPLYVSKARA